MFRSLVAVICSHVGFIVSAGLIAVMGACAAAPAASFDVVVAGGRAIDPESGLDAIRWIGIRDGRIEAVSQTPLTGTTVLDATGLVVAPGFIDMHAHGQDSANYRLFALNGVTTALEMEVGTEDVGGWYTQRAAGTLIHHGVSVGHVRTRMQLFEDGGSLLPSGPGAHRRATADEVAELRRRVRRGLEDGALGVGFGLQYTPAATRWEVLEMFREAAAARAPRLCTCAASDRTSRAAASNRSSKSSPQPP